MLVLRARQPETKPRSCGNQSAHESMFNRRLRVLSPAVRSSEPALPATAETNNCVRTLEREHESRLLGSENIRHVMQASSFAGRRGTTGLARQERIWSMLWLVLEA